MRDEDGRLGPFKGLTDQMSRNFLIFRLGDDPVTGSTAKVTLRPSGTEPKTKAYIEVGCGPCPEGATDEEWETMCAGVRKLVDRIAEGFLKKAGVA